MWNAYERLFDGNSVNWFFFVHAACVPPCSVYLLYSSWPHQPFNSAQCNTSATGPIEQTSRYQRKSLCVPKLLCQMRAFMISSDIFCFEITLSKQITDTFASIYIRHSNTHTHPFGSSTFSLRIAQMISNEWATLRPASVDRIHIYSYAILMYYYFVSFTHFIFSELRTQNTWGISFWGQWVNILRVILSFALHLVRKLMVLL